MLEIRYMVLGSKGDIRSASHCVLPPPAALDMAQDEIKDFCAPITLLPHAYMRGACLASI